MSYRDEFPDYDGDFYCPEGWIDNSWHNDVCPRAMKRLETDTKCIEFSIWQDYLFEDKREYDDGKRYLFQIHVNNDLIYHYETDSILEIQNLVKGVQV